MKGYIINNRCYIFPQEVGQIPSIEAEIIYVQEEDIKAWKEANAGVADKIKKYNYNVITVNPKEWSGHKDDELAPVQTPHSITKESYNYGDANAADFISIDKQSATAGEIVTVTLTDPVTYTLDLANKEKQRIWINRNLPNIEYHQEGDNYTFTMSDRDTSILAGYYNGHKLTVTVDGEEKSTIEDVRFLGLHDNQQFVDLTDLTDVCIGNYIALNLAEGYSFNTEDTGKTHVTAKLNGTELSSRPEPDYREFIMADDYGCLLIYLNDNQHNKIKYDGGVDEITGSELIDHDIVNSAVQGETITLYLKDPSTIGYEGYTYRIDGCYVVSYGDERFNVNKIDTYTYQFTMPGSYTIVYIWLEPPTYELTVSGDKSQYVDYLGMTEASQGEIIEFGIKDEGNNLDTYTFDTSAQGKTILTVNWTGIEASNATYDSGLDRWSFTMPANAVNAEVNVYNQA